jgi:hypothetical protein
MTQSLKKEPSLWLSLLVVVIVVLTPSVILTVFKIPVDKFVPQYDARHHYVSAHLR